MATSVCGMQASTSVLEATTSWTKGRSSQRASSSPPLPVTATDMGSSPKTAAAPSTSAASAARTSEWWRW